MCTPSLAIDAIIEIHHDDEGEINHSEKIKSKDTKSFNDHYDADSSNLQKVISNMGVSSGGVPAVSTAAIRTVSGHSSHKTKKKYEKEILPIKDLYGNHDQRRLNGKNGNKKDFTNLEDQPDKDTIYPFVNDLNVRILSSNNLIHGLQTRNMKNNLTNGKDNMNGNKKYRDEKKKRDKNQNISIVLVYRGAPPAGYAIPGGENC